MTTGVEMKMLIQGRESATKIKLLISITSIRSERIIEALERHYVLGWNICNLVDALNIDENNFRRADKILNNVADIVVKINDEN